MFEFSKKTHYIEIDFQLCAYKNYGNSVFFIYCVNDIIKLSLTSNIVLQTKALCNIEKGPKLMLRQTALALTTAGPNLFYYITTGGLR